MSNTSTIRSPLFPLFTGLILLLFSSCGDSPPKNTVTQYSTIDALLVGAYDGFVELRQLDEAGNMGIGTFDRLEGEMILLDDEFWQARADGSMVRLADDVTTPFASVCQFNPDLSGELGPQPSLSALTKAMDEVCPNSNGIYAVKIKGEFKFIKTRSVPAQKKPYPPLAEVAENQPEFEHFDSTGTVIGFRLPPYIKGLNVPGWHLHYLSEDRTAGGHILDLQLTNGSYQVDGLSRMTIELDESGRNMAGLDLSKDRSEELKQVEGTE